MSLLSAALLPPSFPRFPAHLPLGRSGASGNEQREEAEFLAAVQGNILQGHGRDWQRWLFFNLPETRLAQAEFLRALTEPRADGHKAWVDSAADQRTVGARWQAARRAGLRAEPTWFGGVMLTRTGLRHLGVTPPPDEPFRLGLKKRMARQLAADEMNEAPYACAHPEAEVFHGVLLLASDDAAVLAMQAEAFRAWCDDAGGTVLAVTEQGTAWRAPGDPYGTGYAPPREAFGFVDGISGPRFFADQRAARPERGPEFPTAWAWTDLALSDVFFTEGEHAGGTYAACLKIEQDVAAFRAYEAIVAARLRAAPVPGLSAAQAAYVAPALLMGRTRLGYPLSEGPADPRTWPETESGWRELLLRGGDGVGGRRPAEMPGWLNEFSLADAAGRPRPGSLGSGCPFQAHIRKMNPRVDAPAESGDRGSLVQAQAIRRGCVYDPADQLGRRERGEVPAWPARGTGMLFLAYMRDLARQFEQAHNHWALDTAFPAPGGADPVLAAPAAAWEAAGVALPPMPRVVRRLGGIYLYVPALTWLRRRRSS